MRSVKGNHFHGRREKLEGKKRRKRPWNKEETDEGRTGRGAKLSFFKKEKEINISIYSIYTYIRTNFRKNHSTLTFVLRD